GATRQPALSGSAMAVGARRVADAADERGSSRARDPPHAAAHSLGVAFQRRGRRGNAEAAENRRPQLRAERDSRLTPWQPAERRPTRIIGPQRHGLGWVAANQTCSGTSTKGNNVAASETLRRFSHC